MVLEPMVTNATTLAKTRIYREHPFDPTLRRAEDWDFWIRACRTSVFRYLDVPLFYRREADLSGRPRISRELMGYTTRILLRHGPAEVGWMSTLCRLGYLYIRAVVRTVMILLHLHRFFKGERASYINPEELRLALDGLDRISRVKLPDPNGAAAEKLSYPSTFSQ